MSTRQPKNIVALYLSDSELLRTAHAHQSFESVEGHFGTACHELEELSSFGVFECLKDFPKPDYLRRVCIVARYIFSVLLQIIDYKPYT